MDWAEQFQQQQAGGAWSEQFLRAQQPPHSVGGMWATEFAGAPGEWATEFAQAQKSGDAASGEGQWADAYEAFLAEATQRDAAAASVSREDYDFIAENPYADHPDPLSEGRALFRRGVLSEAVLALEAAVQRDPQSCEGWRLLVRPLVDWADFGWGGGACVLHYLGCLETLSDTIRV